MVQSLSVVIPMYKEQDNVFPLYQELTSVLKKLKLPYEILFVDDGSPDQTFTRLRQLHAKDKHVKVIRLQRNSGQTAAMDAGFCAAQGRVIVTMDGDLQNDPASIPALLAKIDEGYDAVSGWRASRHDSFGKKFYSRLANWLRKKLLKENIHDAGCALKAYKREAIQDLELYGEMHRYVISLVALRGFNVGEARVNHRHRIHGQTKYGFKRLLHGFLDLLFIKFLTDYSTRPLHFFGLVSIAQYGLAFVIFVEQVIKAFYLGFLSVGPLLVLIVLLAVTGTLTIIFGFLAELLIRTYYAASHRKPYTVAYFLH